MEEILCHGYYLYLSLPSCTNILLKKNSEVISCSDRKEPYQDQSRGPFCSINKVKDQSDGSLSEMLSTRNIHLNDVCPRSGKSYLKSVRV